MKAVVSIGLLWLLLAHVDLSRLWAYARGASPAWLATALLLYLLMVLVSAWRWGLLLHAQHVRVTFSALTSSFLVATFFNNFLPSNIGGDVIRIADTARPAGSKTLATTVVLIDRAVGLLGLVLVAAIAATAGHRAHGQIGPVGPAALWSGFGLATVAAMPVLLMPERLERLLKPLSVIHPEWVLERLARLTGALTRLRERPEALVGCFAGAVVVQGILVAFYVAIARSMNVPVTLAQLALVVPVSFIVQLLPVSMNGLGVREAVFGLYFRHFGLPLDAALAVSFVGAAMTALFSLSGGVMLLARGPAKAYSKVSSA